MISTSKDFFQGQYLKLWSQNPAHGFPWWAIQLLGRKDCVSLMARPAIVCHSTDKGQSYGSEEIGEESLGLFAWCCRWVLGYARAKSVRRKGSRMLDFCRESGLCEQEFTALKASMADLRTRWVDKNCVCYGMLWSERYSSIVLRISLESS